MLKTVNIIIQTKYDFDWLQEAIKLRLTEDEELVYFDIYRTKNSKQLIITIKFKANIYTWFGWIPDMVEKHCYHDDEKLLYFTEF